MNCNVKFLHLNDNKTNDRGMASTLVILDCILPILKHQKYIYKFHLLLKIVRKVNLD